MEQELLGENLPLFDIIDNKIKRECEELINSFRNVVSQPTKKDENKKALEAAIICQRHIMWSLEPHSEIWHYNHKKYIYLNNLVK